MARIIGEQAVIVGAGIGGLTTARVLVDRFERVLVLERDTLPAEPDDRPGIPQGRHVHALLRGGQEAIEALLPGFERDLAAGGAVRLRAGLDLRVERPGFDPFPQRDLGIGGYAMSRALLETTVRRLVQARGNVEICQGCRVQDLIVQDGAVRGVRYATGNGPLQTLDAGLVVDASGRGSLTLETLDALGCPRPDETTIGVDLTYATAVFEIPDDAPAGWKGVFCFSAPGRPRLGALLLPLEAHRWIVTVAARHAVQAPGDEAGFMEFIEKLRTPTVFDALRHAKRLGDIRRFGFRESINRHYERLREFPRGLLPIGDAVCRFNPVHGQGMSVAAMEARALGRLLATREDEADPLGDLAPAFFAEAAALIETPWVTAAIPDFVHPQTRGERPPNFTETIRFGLALTKLAARDPAVHRLTAEVQHLLKPRSVFLDPELMQRMLAVMNEQETR